VVAMTYGARVNAIVGDKTLDSWYKKILLKMLDEEFGKTATAQAASPATATEPAKPAESFFPAGLSGPDGKEDKENQVSLLPYYILKKNDRKPSPEEFYIPPGKYDPLAPKENSYLLLDAADSLPGTAGKPAEQPNTNDDAAQNFFAVEHGFDTLPPFARGLRGANDGNAPASAPAPSPIPAPGPGPAPGPVPSPSPAPAPATEPTAGSGALQGLIAGALGGTAGIAKASKPAEQDPFAQGLTGEQVGEDLPAPDPTEAGQTGDSLTEAEELEALLEDMKSKNAPYEAIRSLEQEIGKLQTSPNTQAIAPVSELPPNPTAEDALKLYKKILEFEKTRTGMQYSNVPTDGIDRYIAEINGQFSALPPKMQKQAKKDLIIEASPFTKMRKKKLELERMRVQMEKYGISTADIEKNLAEVSRQFKDMRQYYAQGDDRWGNKPYKKEGSSLPASDYLHAGCGPSSMAMIFSSYLQDDSITPLVAGKWAADNYCRHVKDGKWQGGTDEEFISKYAESFGYKAVKVKSEAQLAEYLKQGYMAVVHMPDHYAVIEGYIGRMPEAQNVYRYDDDDNVKLDGTRGGPKDMNRYFNLFDPNRRGKKQHDTYDGVDPWSYKELGGKSVSIYVIIEK
jgi:hypothetical protein